MRTTLLFGILVLSTAAQPNGQPPAILQIEGAVDLDQARVRAPVNLTGDAVIRTGAGRVEIHLSDGALLFLGENSSARLTARQQNMAKSRLEVMDGSAVVITGSSGGLMDCEDAVTLSDHAMVRLDVHPVTVINSFTGLPYGGHSCGIKVYEGAAAARLQTIVTC